MLSQGGVQRGAPQQQYGEQAGAYREVAPECQGQGRQQEVYSDVLDENAREGQQEGAGRGIV